MGKEGGEGNGEELVKVGVRAGNMVRGEKKGKSKQGLELEKP